MLSRKLYILVDSREQQPLLFPSVIPVWKPRRNGGADRGARPAKPHYMARVVVERTPLKSGDYTLKGLSDVCVIERKKNIESEITHNLLSADRPRFLRALNRLSESCAHPYLWVERLLASGFEKDILNNRFCIDTLYAECQFRGIQVIWGGLVGKTVAAKRRVGEVAMRLMLSHALRERRWPLTKANSRHA